MPSQLAKIRQRRLDSKARYAAHREEVLEKKRKQYAENREAILAYSKQRYSENSNRKQKKASSARYYRKNREAILASRREKYAEDLKKFGSHQKFKTIPPNQKNIYSRYYQKHRETLLAKRKKQYAENPEKKRAACTKYYREHKEIVLAKKKKKYNEESKNNPLINNYEQLKKQRWQYRWRKRPEELGQSNDYNNDLKRNNQTQERERPCLYQKRSNREEKTNRVELEKRKKAREEQIARLLEEKGEFYSLVLVKINKKLTLQNGLWAQMRH